VSGDKTLWVAVFQTSQFAIQADLTAVAVRPVLKEKHSVDVAAVDGWGQKEGAPIGMTLS
jgi:hypothetical protein